MEVTMDKYCIVCKSTEEHIKISEIIASIRLGTNDSGPENLVKVACTGCGIISWHRTKESANES